MYMTRDHDRARSERLQDRERLGAVPYYLLIEPLSPHPGQRMMRGHQHRPVVHETVVYSRL